MLDLRLRPRQILHLYYRKCGESFNAMIDEIKALKPKSRKHKRGKTRNA